MPFNSQYPPWISAALKPLLQTGHKIRRSFRFTVYTYNVQTFNNFLISALIMAEIILAALMKNKIQGCAFSSLNRTTLSLPDPATAMYCPIWSQFPFFLPEKLIIRLSMAFPFQRVSLVSKSAPETLCWKSAVRTYYTIFPFPFPVPICAVWPYSLTAWTGRWNGVICLLFFPLWYATIFPVRNGNLRLGGILWCGNMTK